MKVRQGAALGVAPGQCAPPALLPMQRERAPRAQLECTLGAPRVPGRCVRPSSPSDSNRWWQQLATVGTTVVGSSGSENVSPEGLLERGRAEEGKDQRVSKTDGEGSCERTDTVKI